MTKQAAKILHKKISSNLIQKEQVQPKQKTRKMALEDRVSQIERMKPKDIRALARSLGFSNIEFKQINQDDRSKSINRPIREQAVLIYWKEKELDL